MAEENKAIQDLNKEVDQNSLTIENEDNDQPSNENEDDKYKDILEVKEEFIKSKKKKSLLSKILIGLIGFLLLLLIVGIILYFLGYFTPKEDIQANKQENIMPVEIKEETYKFDIKDINSKKLNEQLSYLTNKNINQDRNEELEKIENEKRIIEEQKVREAEALRIQEEALLKEKEAIEEKQIQLANEKAELEAMRQEAMLIKAQLEANKVKLEEAPIENIEAVIDQMEEQKLATPIINNTNNNFLKFINVAKIKGSLYKKYLDKIADINPNVMLCRDDRNRIEIYFGPFNDDKSRSELLAKLLENKFEEAYEVEFTQEEFDKRCNY
jgi:hypothetical protein